MFFSGIADEAAPDLERQLEAHKELGWKHIEIRNINGTNLTDLDDAKFDEVAGRIEASGMQVSCFASQLANWSRPVDGDFHLDLDEMERAVTRMERLGTPFIRCMSYPNAKPAWADREWRREAVRRLRGLARMAGASGVTLVHENCSGWGGQGPDQTNKLVEEVDSEYFKLVWDTGNPQQEKQDAWDYFRQVQEHVVYVHIKDYVFDESGKEKAVFPGEGEGAVRKTLRTLFDRGYDGGVSIEPHITSVIHLQQEASDPELSYRTYVEYGQRLEALVKSL